MICLAQVTCVVAVAMRYQVVIVVVLGPVVVQDYAREDVEYWWG